MTALPSIPRLYTALAECLAVGIYALPLGIRFGKTATIAASAAKDTNTTRKVTVKTLLTGEDRVAVEGDLQPGDELVVKTTKATGSTNNRRMGPPI